MSASKPWSVRIARLVRRSLGLGGSLFIVSILLAPTAAQAQLDTGNNGMSDIWERHFNNGNLFDPANPDHAPTADPDGDGWTNLEESIAGTDPFSGKPPQGLVVTHITHLANQPGPETPEQLVDLAIISWDTLPGKLYTLSASPDLTPGSWITVGPPITGSGQPEAMAVTLTDAGGENPDKLFWRVNIEDPLTDSDGDGLTDYEEYLLGSNPYAQSTTNSGISDLWIAENLAHDPTIFQTFNPHATTAGGGSSYIESYLSGTNPNLPVPNVPPAWIHLSTEDTPPGEPPPPRQRFVMIQEKTRVMIVVAISSEEFKQFTSNASEYNDELTWRIVVGDEEDENIIEGSVNVNDIHAAWLISESADFRVPGLTNYAHVVAWHSIQSPAYVPLALQITITAANVGDSEYPSDIAIGILPLNVHNLDPGSGVDNVSLTANVGETGRQDDFWIMAPLPGAEITETKLKLNRIPDLEGTLVCDDVTSTPTLFPPDGAFHEISWQTDTGTGIEQSSPVSLRLGALPDTFPLPLQIKSMKRRTVKVKVVQAGKAEPGGVITPSTAMMPTKAEMESHLDRIFGRQINAWFEITHNPALVHAVDWGDEFRHGTAEIHSADQELVINASGGLAADYDIHVYMLAHDDPIRNLDGEGAAQGVAIVDHKTCWMLCTEVEAYNTKQQLLNTLAHEIGHILLGPGHPDTQSAEEDSVARLAGTDWTKRLMFSSNGTNSILLVKAEWDKAEDWLIANPDAREEQNTED